MAGGGPDMPYTPRSASAPRRLGEEALGPAVSSVQPKAASPGQSLRGALPTCRALAQGTLAGCQPHTEHLARLGLEENIFVLHEEFSSQSPESSEIGETAQRLGRQRAQMPVSLHGPPPSRALASATSQTTPHLASGTDSSPSFLSRRPASRPGCSWGRPPLRKAWAGRPVSVPGGWQGQVRSPSSQAGLPEGFPCGLAQSASPPAAPGGPQHPGGPQPWATVTGATGPASARPCRGGQPSALATITAAWGPVPFLPCPLKAGHSH